MFIHSIPNSHNSYSASFLPCQDLPVLSALLDHRITPLNHNYQHFLPWLPLCHTHASTASPITSCFLYFCCSIPCTLGATWICQPHSCFIAFTLAVLSARLLVLHSNVASFLQVFEVNESVPEHLI